MILHICLHVIELPTVDSLTFHLDSVTTDPLQSRSAVFTLTCNSSGGPVQWWRGNDLLSDDSVYDMTQTLVSHSGPQYSSTLSARRRTGTYQCVVSNIKGNSTEALYVPGMFILTVVYTASLCIYLNVNFRCSHTREYHCCPSQCHCCQSLVACTIQRGHSHWVQDLLPGRG